MIFKNDIENGTVDPSLPDYAVKYSISTSDVYDTVPGSVTYQNFDEGVQILRIDLSALTIYIEKDWTNRKSLSNQNKIILKKGNITKTFKFSKVYPFTINSLPATRVILTSDATSQDLFDFIGATGAPGATGLGYLSLQPQNDYAYNDLSSDFQTQRRILNYETDEFSVDFSWKNAFNVKYNQLRWRSTPILNRVTRVYYYVVDSGEYTSLPNAFVNSSWGAGETINLSGSVKRIEVLDGGQFDGTPAIIATYSGASGASFSVGMTGNAIDTISVVTGGLGFNESPVISTIGATVISAPSFQSYIEIGAINQLTIGYDYVAPPTISLVGGSGASGSIGATVQVFNEGRIDYIKVLSGGTGYVTGQEVIFSGGGGTGARATVIADDSIIAIKILDGGYNYTSSPTVSVTTGATAAVLEAVVSLYADWNYITIEPDNPGYTVDYLKKYLEYEWQIYSALEKKQNFVNYSPTLKFKFF
jgi:hypothetical protein